MKCVQFIFYIPSLPAPRRLWSVPLSEEVMAAGAPISSVKEPLQKTFSIPSFWGAPNNEAYGFTAQNWEEPLNTLQCIDLNQEGKALAKEWLTQLQQSIPNSEAYDNHFANLALLLWTMADNKSCSFTEAEFAPFTKTLGIEAEIVSSWKDKQLII
jgi:hypothetical protein